MCEYCRLINAIDAYILKADDDLADMMDKAGFCNSKDSVKAMNKTEDKVSVVLTDQTERIIKKLKRAKSLQEARENIDQFFETDEETTAQLTEVFETFYSDSVQEYASSYMKETAGDMTVNQLRSRTKAWIFEWSGRLSEMMQLTSRNQMGQLIERAVSDGKSVADLARQIMEAGLRNEEWRARRAARTEMLRAHSVARDEAIMQNPTVNRRRWRHSGTSKIEPRQNHVDMDGQMVEKDKPYTLIGRDGNTYHPRFPRDPVLPAGESVNCGCTEQAIVDDDVLGMGLEEREALQRQIIEEDNGAWEKELSSRNRKRSGIDDGGLKKAGISKANGVFVNKVEKLAKYAKKITPEEGFSDFTCHCDGERFYIDMIGLGNEEDYIGLAPEELADHIRDSKEFKEGPIRLISCGAGRDEYGPAKKVAEHLGVQVKAATEDVYVDEDGNIFISDYETLADMWYNNKKYRDEYTSTGTWKVFNP